MRNVILLVLVQVHISYSKWACNEDNGWLIDLKDINNFDGGSTCRKDSFNANCKGTGISSPSPPTLKTHFCLHPCFGTHLFARVPLGVNMRVSQRSVNVRIEEEEERRK